MNSTLCLIILGLSAYISYLIITKSGFFDRTVDVVIEGSSYRVIENMPDKEEAARRLRQVDIYLNKLINHINNKFTDDYIYSQDLVNKGKGDVLRKIKRRLASTYKSNSLKENFPSTPKIDVSYNLNKGETIAMCLRDYENENQFHDINEVLFVAVHELAHSLNCDESSILCGNSYGHDDMFWYIFKILLENAQEANIYVKKNYKKNPVDYCSMNITYSPLYDETLHDKHFKIIT